MSGDNLRAEELRLVTQAHNLIEPYHLPKAAMANRYRLLIAASRFLKRGQVKTAWGVTVRAGSTSHLARWFAPVFSP
jgi:hypothetical protein